MSRTRASADNLPGELTETTRPACWAAPQSAQGFQLKRITAALLAA